MNRKTLIAFVVLGIVVALAVVVTRQPEKGQITGERPRPIPKLAAGSFDTLTVTKGTSTTTIKKEGDSYKITAPAPYPADQGVAKTAFESIEKLEYGSIVTDQKAKHTEFEVDDKALKVVVKKGEQTLAELLIGKNVGGNTLVRVPGKDEVWQALGSFRYSLDRDTTGWRDKTISTFPQGDAEKVELKTRDHGHAIVKKESGDKWTVVESSVKVDKLDNTVPTGIVSALGSWTTNDFADDAKPETTGLANPENTITVSLKGGKTVSVLVGNKKGSDDFYVKKADAPQVYLVKKYNLDRIDKKPIDLRDKTLCDLAEGDLAQIAVTHEKDSYTLARGADKTNKDKNAWGAAKPKGLTTDTAKVNNITSGFKDWKATGFADDQSLKANGLDKPTAVISATGKDKKKSCTLKVGAETTDKANMFVAEGSDVFLVPKWSVDRLLVKVDDLKKK